MMHKHELKELTILVPPMDGELPNTHGIKSMLRQAMTSHMEFRHVNDFEFKYGIDENYAAKFALNVGVETPNNFHERCKDTYYKYISDLMTELKTHDTEKEAYDMMPLVEKYAERWDRENCIPVLSRTLRVVANGCKFEIIIDRKYDTSG